ncbi:MAG: hypothetical protein GXP27_20000 [Planctomycetes bacterium]|nr:hypothetical protein [Planctomycetota bacterium]
MPLAILLFAVAAPASEPGQLAFRPAEKEGFFQFDTGVLRGVLRLDGKRQGIEQLIHEPTGQEVTYGGGHVGLLSPYRLFSTGTRYGHAARDWPSRPRLLPDGAVEARFPAAEDHPLELTLTYRWVAPDTLDLTTQVTPKKNMPRFEFFLSSYFADGFAVSVYLKPNRFERGGKPRLMPVQAHPLFDGNYMMFPRDREAVLTIFDGRWEIPPNPVQWCITRWMAAPLALRRHGKSGVTAVLMAPPEECFSVATPYDKTPPDGVAGHRSLYLCLFGQDVAAGQTVRARTRLVVGTSITDEVAVQRYQQFLQGGKQ